MRLKRIETDISAAVYLSLRTRAQYATTYMRMLSGLMCAFHLGRCIARGGKALHIDRTCMQLLALQARAMEGTRPSIVTRALSTKAPNGRPRGDPCTRAQGGYCRLSLDSVHTS